MPTLKMAEKSTPTITVNIATQTLAFYNPSFDAVHPQRIFSVSTAKNGIGSLEGTGCTPLGKHYVASKIGDQMPINSVFVGRLPTGEIYHEQLAQQHPDRDWILSRILWLSGCEQGINKGDNEQGCCDTYRRYIYIHGTPDTEPMGVPMSHGCVRMRNEDVIWLFDQVQEGMPVDIIAK